MSSSQPDLPNEFQDSQDNTEKPCFKQTDIFKDIKRGEQVTLRLLSLDIVFKTKRRCVKSLPKQGSYKGHPKVGGGALIKGWQKQVTAKIPCRNMSGAPGARATKSVNDKQDIPANPLPTY